ncbi:putative signal peptidase complex subunit 2 [Chlorella vulgaris]
MAPSRKKPRKEELDVFTEEQETGPKIERIDLGDTASLKRALDDAVIQAACDAGHTIDNTYTDAKIVLGLLACAIACFAQFYPKLLLHFPKLHLNNTWLVAGCVVAYAILSSLMTVVAMLFEKDAIALTRAVPGGPPALAIASRLPRFAENYTLQIALRDAPEATKCGSGSGAAALTKSVGAYFHEDGQLAADVIKQDAAKLLAQAVASKSQ